MPSFYDLLKYAKTGIASSDMTAYDKVKALAMAGGAKYPVSTITGIPPISFKADGSALTDILIGGNMMQSGTPSPTNPIYPSETGERTGNLVKNDGVSVEYRGVKYTVNPDKSITAFGTATSGVSYFIFAGDGVAGNSINSYNTPIFKAGETLVFSTNSQTPINARFTDGTYSGSSFLMNEPITLTKDIGLLYIQVVGGNSINTTVYPMVNTGSTDIPYEPYGYKIPITSAGQTVPVYLGQVQTVRRIKKIVFDGTETGWGKNTGLTNSNAFSITMPNWVGNRKMGYCTHYQNVTDAQSAQGVYFGNSLNILTAFADGLDDATKFKQWLADEYATGNPVTVWYVLATPETDITNEPLAKIGTYADTLDSADAGIVIPTVHGSNVLSVGTDLQPSEMTITGHIKPL